MIIRSISINNIHTFRPMASFKGVSMDNYNPLNTGDDMSENEGSEIVRKFNMELAKIRQNALDKKNSITGLFKSKKKQTIERDEDNQISGFLLGQKCAVDQQEELVKILQDQVVLLQKNNATELELAQAKKALDIAQKAMQAMKYMTQQKNSKKGFDSIAGYEKEKFILTDNFTSLLPYEQAGANIKLPNCILFYGPVGNGKTSFATAFAESAGCKFEKAEATKRSRNRQEVEQSLFDDLVKKAQESQENFLNTGIRTIILLDEIDRVGYENSPILPKLKRFLQDCSEKYHCTVFATTNNPLELPSPLRSEQRMPIKVSIDPPNYDNAKAILIHYLEDCPNINVDSLDIDALTDELCSVNPTRAYNASQIEAIVLQCAKNYEIPTQQDLMYEIKKEVPGNTEEELNKYHKEKKQLGGSDDQ